MYNFDQWDGFEGRLWKEEINTRDFIQKNLSLIHIFMKRLKKEMIRFEQIS